MTSHDRPLWGLAVLTLVVIEPALRVFGNPGITSPEFAELAASMPTATYAGILTANVLVTVAGYAVWRLLSAWRIRTAIPTVLSMVGTGLLIVHFAALGGFI